ncbi:MAG: SRPBCC family protein [Chloroflexota bacterium]
MNVQRQVTVNAPADKVWNILGADFTNISEWASFVVESKPIPNMPEGSGRVCNVKGTGEVKETIHKYDEDNRELAFVLEGKKIPFFMQKIDNTWSVKPKGNDRSELQVNVDLTVMPVFKQLMSGMLRKQMSKTADSILGELKYFAENDRAKVPA